MSKTVQRTSTLLTIDAVVNLALGVLLLTFADPVVEFLGVPASAEAFYPNILGAVLFGIGIALWLARGGRDAGLGLAGAVAINLCAGLVLALWLIFGELAIPTHGRVFLWALVALLVGLSSFEIASHARRRRGPDV